jgi:nicotinamide mononucleotide transporter PnuC
MVNYIFRIIKEDIKSFSVKESIITTFLILFSIFIGIFDINYIIGISKSPLVWINNENAGLELWKNIAIVCNIFGSCFAIIGIIMSIKGKLSNFIWNIMSSIIYCFFCIAIGYIGGFQMEAFILFPLRISGIILWRKHLDNKNSAVVNRLKLLKILLLLLYLFVAFIFFYFEIRFVCNLILGNYQFENNQNARIIESIISAIGVSIHTLATLRYLEQWLLRIINCIIQITFFSGIVGLKLNLNAIFLWIIGICISINALITWIKRMKEQENGYYKNVELEEK